MAAVINLPSFDWIICLFICCETAVLKMDKTLENPRKLVLKPDDYVTADWAGDFIYTVYITFYIYISKQFSRNELYY